jgi:hypothetical protein
VCILVLKYIHRFTLRSADNLRFNSTFKLQQQKVYNSSHQGILSYTPAIVAPVTLQSLIGDDATNQLIPSLTKSLDNMHQTPLQKVQYAAQLKLLKEGKAPFLNMVVFATGGFASVPAPNTSYATIAIMQVVSPSGSRFPERG